MAMPSIFSKAVEAASGGAEKAAFQDNGKVLVVIQLAGGNDGIDTVIPFADPRLAGLRPTLKQTESQLAFKLNQQLGMHSALAPLQELWAGGKLAVVQNVGYPNPSLSHFQSMDIWETMDLEGREGWTSGRRWTSKAARAGWGSTSAAWWTRMGTPCPGSISAPR